MKLRPSTKDYTAIKKLKHYYNEATGTKAIFRAVYDVPIMSSQIDGLNQEINKLSELLNDAATAQAYLLDGLKDLELSRKAIRNR